MDWQSGPGYEGMEPTADEAQGWPVWLLVLCAVFYGLVLGLLLWFLAPAVIRGLAEWAR